MRGEGSGGRMSERKRGQGALTITGFRSEIKTQWNMDAFANTLIRLTIETLRWNNPPLNQTIAESLSPIVIPTHDALYARHLQPTEASLLWLPIPLERGRIMIIHHQSIGLFNYQHWRSSMWHIQFIYYLFIFRFCAATNNTFHRILERIKRSTKEMTLDRAHIQRERKLCNLCRSIIVT